MAECTKTDFLILIQDAQILWRYYITYDNRMQEEKSKKINKIDEQIEKFFVFFEKSGNFPEFCAETAGEDS